MLGEVAPTQRQELLFWLWFTAKVSRGHDTAIPPPAHFTSGRQTKQREKMRKSSLSSISPINNPKLTPCSPHRSIFNREQHLLVFYEHRIQLCILAGKTEFPIPWIGPSGHICPWDYETLGILKTSDAALNEADPGGHFHKNLPNLFMLQEKDWMIWVVT